MSKTIQRAMLLLLAIFGCSTAFAEEIKIGVVDVHTIIKQLPQTQKIDEQLQKEFKPRQQKIMELQKNLQTSIETLNKEKAVMKDAERDKLAQRIDADRSSLMRMQQSFQDDLTNAQRQSMEKLLNEVQDTIGKIAKKEGFDVVLQKESLPFFTARMDITDRVLKNLKGTA